MKKKYHERESYIVVGLGRFGRSIARSLASQGYEVLAIDHREDYVEKIADQVTHALIGDVTDEQFLESIGASNFDAAIVAISNDVQPSILVTLKLKELGVEYVVARARDELHERLLTKVGADKVIQVEKDMGKKLAKSLISPHYVDGISLSQEYSIVETIPLKSWIGKTKKEILLSLNNSITIMAVKRGETINTALPDDFRIETGDIMVIIGTNEKLDYIC